VFRYQDLSRHSTSTRLFLLLIGSYGKFGWSKFEKFLFIKDQQAFRKSLEKVLAWDFDRIIFSHGKSIEAGGKAYLLKAFPPQ